VLLLLLLAVAFLRTVVRAVAVADVVVADLNTEAVLATLPVVAAAVVADLPVVGAVIVAVRDDSARLAADRAT